MFNLFRCFFLFLLPCGSVRRSYFDRGLQNSTMLIQITTDKYEKNYYVAYIYMYKMKALNICMLIMAFLLISGM